MHSINSGAGFKSTRTHAAWTLEIAKQRVNDALREKYLGGAAINLSGGSLVSNSLCWAAVYPHFFINTGCMFPCKPRMNTYCSPTVLSLLNTNMLH